MLTRLFLSVSIAAVSATAHAGETEADAPYDGDPILVIGQSQGYLTTGSTTATKTDTPLLDTPQTVNVVTREQIED